MSDKQKREFDSVKAIFETFIPCYTIRSEELPERDQTKIGAQLASEILEKFRSNIRTSRAASARDGK